MNPNLVYTCAQSEAIDRYAIHECGICSYDLMSRAGEGAWRKFQRNWPQARSPAIVCGPGNNGGDGYVLASHALQAGLVPRVYALGEPKTADASRGCAEYVRQGGIRNEFSDCASLRECDSVVDAIFGIGLSRPPQGPLREAIRAIRQSGLPVLALDVPSGLDADTGIELGIAVRADITVTFITRKIGLYTGHGSHFSGRIELDRLEVPQGALAHIDAAGSIVSESEIGPLLPKRVAHAHKGNAGRVAIIGGNATMEGAAIMAARASFRTGAGLVSMIMPSDKFAGAQACPEVRVIPASDPVLVTESASAANAIGIGPGMGTDAWARGVWELMRTVEIPLVVDADALNLLARSPLSRPDWILTPHPAEAARLLGVKTSAVQSDRCAAAKEIVHRYGGVCVLKGAGTLIATADDLWVCDRGNSGMATGGMGDVLTGVICALRSQGMAAAAAARTGVWIHACAGDDCASEFGPIGMMSTDLLPFIRTRVNRLANEF